MRLIAYISGIAGATLLVLRLLAIFVNIPYQNLLLISGLILIFIVCIPTMMIEKNKPYKINIQPNSTQKSKLKVEEGSTDETGKEEEKVKGWGMNNSPFRTRRSGLTWGGGNIKGANAERGARRGFMKL